MKKFLVGLSLFVVVSLQGARVFTEEAAQRRVDLVTHKMEKLEKRRKVATIALAFTAAGSVAWYLGYRGYLSSTDNQEQFSGLSGTEIEKLKQFLNNPHYDDLFKPVNVGSRIWGYSKNVAPFLVGQALFPVIDYYVRYIQSNCFPQVTFPWFSGMYTRYPQLMMVFEERAKLLPFEKDKQEQIKMVSMIDKALECAMDHAGSLVGYMYFKSHQTESIDQEMAHLIKQIADHSAHLITEFNNDMNDLLSNPGNYIGVPGRIERFQNEFNHEHASFTIYEREIMDPSLKE
jgi:hypothetical protein